MSGLFESERSAPEKRPRKGRAAWARIPRSGRGRAFSAAFALFLLLLAFVGFLKPAVFPRVAWDNVLFAHPPAVHQAGLKIPLSLAFLATWAGIFAWMTRAARRARADAVSAPVALVSLVGIGAVLVLAAEVAGLAPGRALTLSLLVAPFLAHSAWLFSRGRKAAGAPERAPNAAPGAATRAAAAVLISLLVLQLASDLVYMLAYRGSAAGDELNFWWSGFRELHAKGIHRYLREFEVAGYVPGYPLLAAFFGAFVPKRLMGRVDAMIPILQGMMLAWMLAWGARRRGPRLLEAAFLCAVFALLFLSDSWVRAMVFRHWYGEAMGVLVAAALFLELSRRDSRADAWGLSLAFGLGAFARVSKAPLAVTFLYAVAPLFLLSALAFRGAAWKARALKSVAAASGALAVQVLWARAMSGAAIQDLYAVDLSTVLNPDFTNLRENVIPFIVKYYKKQLLVPFALVTVLALALRPRRHAAALLSAVALVAAVLALYATYWRTMEHESAARYVLHGIYAWILYVVASYYPMFTRVTVAAARGLGEACRARSWEARG